MRKLLFGTALALAGAALVKLGRYLQRDQIEDVREETARMQREPVSTPIVLIECEPSDIGWLGNSQELTRFVRETLGRRLPGEDDKMEWN